MATTAGAIQGGSMDRLTHERSNGIKTGYWSPEKKDALVERLAEYENTGLTPQEIYKLGDERYKGKVIPSTGSAPVTAAVYNGGTGKKGN